MKQKENIRQRIGSQLRAYREAKGYTLRQLAEKAQIDHSHIGKIENGTYDIRVETLQQVASALGCEIVIKEKL